MGFSETKEIVDTMKGGSEREGDKLGRYLDKLLILTFRVVFRYYYFQLCLTSLF